VSTCSLPRTIPISESEFGNPPLSTGILLSQLVLAAFISRQNLFGGREDLVEHAMLVAQLVFLSGVSLLGQLFAVL
jgi:hypothetical protein